MFKQLLFLVFQNDQLARLVTVGYTKKELRENVAFLKFSASLVLHLFKE
jgi:hypothetical protein